MYIYVYVYVYIYILRGKGSLNKYVIVSAVGNTIEFMTIFLSAHYNFTQV